MIHPDDLKAAIRAVEVESKTATKTARTLFSLVPLLADEIGDCHATLEAILKLAPYEIAEVQRLAWNVLHPDQMRLRHYTDEAATRKGEETS